MEEILDQEIIDKARNILNEVCSDVSVIKTETAVDILSSLKLDSDSFVSALLYIPFAHGHIHADEIKEEFSPEVSSMIESLDKLHKVEYNNSQQEAENIRKMYFAITKDIRLIFIKLAFVLSEMRHLELLAQDVKKQKAKVALDLFAPLAARIGASNIKTELEDISFKILHPVVYREIEEKVDDKIKGSTEIIEKLKDYLRKTVSELGIKGDVFGRKKHVYSIFKKLNMEKTHNNLDEIFDLIALRVIVTDVPECYSVLGKIHEDLSPIAGKFKDYIAVPKSNGYQSLHTTVLFEDTPVEIQIRTRDMHKSAEFGFAAHWMYKENRQKMDSLDTRLGWIREMLDESSQMTNQDLIDSLKVDIYDGEIFVQSPLGKVVHLPKDATPIDFAYNIHTDIGNKMVGAKINGKMAPISSRLKNGDIVEISTSQNSKGPSRDWIKFAKTVSARNKMKAFFRRELKDENIKLGKSMLETSARNTGIAFSTLFEKDEVEKILSKYSMNGIEELFAAVGNDSVSANVVVNKLHTAYREKLKKQIKLEEFSKNKSSRRQDEKAVLVKGVDGMMTKIAPCCNPIPNDDIIGFISQGRGVIVHRKECHNVQFYPSERLIEVEWAQNTKKEFDSTIIIKTKNRTNVLAHIPELIVEQKFSMISLYVEKLSKIEDLIRLTIGVQNSDMLSVFMNKILALDGVDDVFRQSSV